MPQDEPREDTGTEHRRPDAPRPATVHAAFEEQARRAPHAVAVRCGTEQLGYGELDRRADRLAAELRQLGLPRGGLVVVSLGRSPLLLVAMLGVLKAGGAYVPVEPTAPDRLLRHVLARAEPFVVLTEEAHRVRLADATERPLRCLDRETEAPLPAPRAAAPAAVAEPADLACVFFTSGSTGLPKGALLEHRNLLSAFHGWQRELGLTPADRHLQSTTFEFDVFTADWLRALCSGGSLIMFEPNVTLDSTPDLGALYQLLMTQQITVVGISARTFQRLYAHISRSGLRLGWVRLLLVGAEKWYLDQQAEVQRYLGGRVRVVNSYGTAEAGIDNLHFEPGDLVEPVTHPERVSLIGRPYPGSEVLVVDAAGRPLGPGVVGEIQLSGAVVGRGYLGEPALTAARFHPVDARPGSPLCYRTGDAGRLREDGLVEYLGRLDAVGGVEAVVELAELDGVLRSHPLVAESWAADIEPVPVEGARAAATAVGAARRPSVRVGYVVPVEPGAPFDAGQVRAYAVERLPAGCRPDVVVPLPALPRTRAGKVDRAGLPLPTARPLDAAGPGRKAGVPLGKTRASALKGRSAAGKAGWRAVAAGSAVAGSAVAGSAVAGSAAAGSVAAAAPRQRGWVRLTLVFAVLAYVLAQVMWPGSTSTSGIAQPWAAFFHLLHLIEDLAFGLGVAFLLLGRPRLARFGRGPGRTTAAWLSISWLLAAWWPQDNLYRVTSASDYPAQVGLTYGFNVTLMIAAWVVLCFLRPPGRPGSPGRS